ncbi:alpha/beta hydrolase [Halalkalibacterium ligniniphilum]|uniref:alpha/beta hydrolase n=1 Tax=Halalkalibacterium ligniniphilum TaxID=1134413 RepID=UPI0003469898|nr:alpha/beta hydrolase [Halalkalibacterium ligniniphilum]
MGINNMKKQVLFIHSAGDQDLHQGSSDLTAYLQERLGDEYNLLNPKMPNPGNPEYKPWKVQLEKEFAEIEGEVILIGHSLGGAVLLKYLSEKAYNQSISGLFLIAAPYWGKGNDWQVEEYTLPENFASKLTKISQMFFYHSCNDEIVPFAHLGHYEEKLPQAITRTLDGNEHYFSDGLPQLVDDIKGL